MWKSLVPLAVLLLCAPTLSSCASFAEEVDHFGFAASSPLRDFNLSQAPIPGQLQALAQPFGHVDQSGCQAWMQEIGSLEASLRANEGRRVGFRRDGGTFAGRSGNLRDSGVRAAVSQFVPFRSVIRQVSGAARFEQLAETASDRARYRIGYLVGLGRANRCPGFGLSSPFAPPRGHVVAWHQPRHIQRSDIQRPNIQRPAYSAAPIPWQRQPVTGYPMRGYSAPAYNRAMPRTVYRPVASAPPATVRRW